MSLGAIANEIRRLGGLFLEVPDHQPALRENTAYRNLCVATKTTTYFLKISPSLELDPFECEVMALTELSDCSGVNTPEIICTGQTDTCSFLLLEHIDFAPEKNDTVAAELVVRLHNCHKPYYGWKQNNYIGRTLQLNACHENWCDFWLEQRLLPQHTLLKHTGVPASVLRKSLSLQTLARELLHDHHPQPVLLHGDLWVGNMGIRNSGQAVVFDPASYYGDRETDIAMTELFGGFSSEFYRNYNQQLPLQDAYHIRKHLYNSYHLLNHILLFGDHYVTLFTQTVDRLQQDM